MTKILIIDDEGHIRQLLKQMLEMAAYTCVLAADAAEARQVLETDTCELILCDISMPGESGVDLIRDILPKYPDTAAIMATAIDDPDLAESTLAIGAYDYLVKPFDRNRLLIAVANALRRRDLEIANRTYRTGLEQMVRERTKKLRKAMDGIIHVIASTVETRDPYTAGHQRRVADLSGAIAEVLGFSEDRIEGILMAGIIHDLGKISIPAEILSKPSRLTEGEFNLIKEHPKIGYDILSSIEFPWPIAQMVYQHHERIDGSGYPQALTAKDILLEAKILGVADVVEAMASNRPYRPGLGQDTALEEISKNRGVCYDPDVVDACLRVFAHQDFSLE
jgi:response regulator RpfG family c-di-GMP phosphodiesterase